MLNTLLAAPVPIKTIWTKLADWETPLNNPPTSTTLRPKTSAPLQLLYVDLEHDHKLSGLWLICHWSSDHGPTGIYQIPNVKAPPCFCLCVCVCTHRLDGRDMRTAGPSTNPRPRPVRRASTALATASSSSRPLHVVVVTIQRRSRAGAGSTAGYATLRMSQFASGSGKH